MVIICIICISSVSAEEIDTNSSLEISNQVQMESDQSIDDSVLEAAADDEEVPDVPDLIFNDTIYIDYQNIDDYFEEGVLQSKYSNKTFVFSQDFENLGKLNISAENVTIRGIGFTLKNTVFELDADNITLQDLNIDLDSEFADNEGAGVLVYSDYANLINLNINYAVPTNVEAYGVYAEGSSNNPIRNFRLLNSTINFEGHNDEANVYNCAVKLLNCKDSVVENNTICSELPLRDIIFGPNGAELASDLVLTVGIEKCDNLSFIGNTLVSEVNKRPDYRYPSLDCMLISKSGNSIIANNSIFMSDFVTELGIDNYLYGLDIYNLDNLTVINNDISIITRGGKLAAGTAYPIQITGPISNVTITENDLYSFSNGPNIGVYSQNFYGETSLSITNNKINVTGLAGAHEWALVAGIESQDSHSIIVNNTIEVHSVGAVSIDDNLYGISYRQSTSGDHQYDIQNNTVFSDGYYSVNLLSSVDSNIFNNLLVSYNPNADSSKSGFKYGDISQHENMEFYNNKVISAFDYFAARENIIDKGYEFNYNPFNNNDVSNNIDGSKISSNETNKKYSYNPLIPGSSDKSGFSDGDQWWTKPGADDNSGDNNEDNTNSQGSGDNAGEASGNSTGRQISLRELLQSFVNSNTDDGKVNTTSYNGHKTDIVANNSDTTPSAEGNDALASQSKSTKSLDVSSAGDSSSISKKVYEIDEKNEIDKFIPSVFFIIPILVLLFIGIRRKKSNFE
ncbi:right-handed parallel beta-helix repeat-containing protein [Methanobrevibacter sp.]|uniref:right-handed parallel beta-helix repeat-containing protein n=1 Tax=Methanobrevibacter sp. TaxID=66852 RepID=UPI00386E2861